MKSIIEKRDFDAFRQGLPQGPHLSDAVIEAWMHDQEASEDFHDAHWHYRRLLGIGGSEAIAAVQFEAQNRDQPIFDAFSSPTQVAQEKLLLTRAEPASPEMLRGNRFEGLIIDRFLEESGAVVRNDIMREVREASGQIEAHPWLTGNPDLIVELRGALILVDIKAPGEKHSASIPLNYACQVHHYREIMAQAGHAPDEMAIGFFNWKDYAVPLSLVPFDRHLRRRLLEGGDALWNGILEGQVPPWPKIGPEPSPFDDQQKKVMEALEERYLLLNALEAQTRDAKNEVAADITEMVVNSGVPARGTKPATFGMEMMSLRATARLNEQETVALCKTLGVPLEDVYVAKGFDADRMADYLMNIGVDLESFRQRQFDSVKAIEALQEAGVSYADLLKRPGDPIESVTPMYRRPTRGKKLEMHELIQQAAQNTLEQARTLLEIPGDPKPETPVPNTSDADTSATSPESSGTTRSPEAPVQSSEDLDSLMQKAETRPPRDPFAGHF